MSLKIASIIYYSDLCDRQLSIQVVGLNNTKTHSLAVGLLLYEWTEPLADNRFWQKKAANRQRFRRFQKNVALA